MVDEDEKTIMNKHALDGHVVRAGPDKGGNNFELPDKVVEIASVEAQHTHPKPKIFYEILNSKNKNFG